MRQTVFFWNDSPYGAFKQYHIDFEFEFIGVLRTMQRYFSHICDGTEMCRRTEKEVVPTLVQLLHYILKCIQLEWRWLFGPYRYMLIQTVWLIV